MTADTMTTERKTPYTAAIQKAGFVFQKRFFG